METLAFWAAIQEHPPCVFDNDLPVAHVYTHTHNNISGYHTTAQEANTKKEKKNQRKCYR